MRSVERLGNIKVPAGAIRCKRVITQVTGWINVCVHAYERVGVRK